VAYGFVIAFRAERPSAGFQSPSGNNRITAPEGIDWSAPAEEVAEQFLQSLDRLSDDHRDRLTPMLNASQR
jgi:hypothetical protein